MIELMKILFPLNRSLSGSGNTKTLDILKDFNKELEIKSFKSQKKVFDWQVPLEWEAKDAYIQHESGKKFACLKDHTLHLASYSKAVDLNIKKKDLLKKILSRPDYPDAIPYVTLYYKDDWAFCMSENQKKKMPDGNYRVFIKATKKIGKVPYGEVLIEGKKKKEIIFSTNICHPSMANNELSGPTVLSYLIRYIKDFKNRKFSYRFLFLPETIGSIAYIEKNYKKLVKNTLAGFVVSCVGDEGPFSLIRSPNIENFAEEILEGLLVGKKKKIYSFLDRGSDERQFCSPLIDLPFCGFSRSKYGTYKQYHTSKDDLNFVSNRGLEQSYNFLKQIFDCFEIGLFPISLVKCEPNLSKRGLYPSIGTSNNRFNKDSLLRLNIMAYSNGKNNIFKLAKLFNKPVQTIFQEIKILEESGLLACRHNTK